MYVCVAWIMGRGGFGGGGGMDKLLKYAYTCEQSVMIRENVKSLFEAITLNTRQFIETNAVDLTLLHRE